MASLLVLVFAAAFVAKVIGDLEYYPDIGGPSDEYTMQELKELFKSGEYLPFDAKDVEYEGGQMPPYYGTQPQEKGSAPPLDEHSPPDPNPAPAPVPAPARDFKRHLNTKNKLFFRENKSPSDRQGYSEEPEFYYNMKRQEGPETKTPFAVPPVDPRYYQQVPSATDNKAELKRAVNEKLRSRFDLEEKDVNYYDERSSGDANDPQEYENAFEEPRQHRQNPNLAATKINKMIYPAEVGSESNSQRGPTITRLNIERDIPTSLVPTSHRHQYVIQQALKNNPGYYQDSNVYLFAMIAGIGAAVTVAVTAFIVGWMRKKSKAANDVEYPAYGVTGPNPEVTPSGDRQLAHSAQMYHYQHQKQQIIAMESRGGVAERNGSVSDAESEDENDEGDYTVYECPGFATTGEMEVKNPLFLDEPAPAIPAQQQSASSSNPKKN
ncbi:uncharacterized protein LOC143922985 isoform X2 [Arctopsyche grandis]|uniref:uncharacterized protein LOC143922985 isoform X2 n=1 Tax=Arctopsyche grandis TaxID=121162 RepID=UPI00406D8D50